MKFSYKYMAAMPVIALAFGFASCEKTDADADKGQTPTIEYARSCDPETLGDHIEGAFLGDKVAFIGQHLGDVQEVWFNDQKSLLNPTMVTSTSILVEIPSNISENVTNNVRFVTSTGKEAFFDFSVLVPAPVLASLDNEWAKPGDVITLTGDFLVSDDEYPLEITFPGDVKVPADNLEIVSRSQVNITVPQGADKEGYITATSRYGEGRSNFVYRDTRAMLFDWDGTHGQALKEANGWRTGTSLVTDSFEGIPALDGKYICFNGTKGDYNDMGEDNFSFNHWSVYDGEGHEPGLDPGSLFDVANFTKYVMKFEVFVPESCPWTMCSLNAILTKAEMNNDNAYVFSDDVPRAMWTPWQATGSYTTGGKWKTITLPLTEFNKTRFLKACPNQIDADWFKGLTFIICWGPETSLVNTPVVVAIDNIRFAPLEEEKPETEK